MRLIAEYSRGEQMRYISHLDVMRTFQRILRRAGFPVAYSQGYNEHMNIAFATATSVGVVSDSEYIDISLTENIDVSEALALLNANAVQGIVFKRARVVSARYPSLMSAVSFSDYMVKGGLSADRCALAFEKLQADRSLVVMKRTKSGVRPTDIKPLIDRCELRQDVFYARLACGSAANLNPKLFYEALAGLAETDPGEILIRRLSLLDASCRDLLSLEDKE